MLKRNAWLAVTLSAGLSTLTAVEARQTPANSSTLTAQDRVDIQALVTGYARALCGIIDEFPGGLNELKLYIPARSLRILKAGQLRQLCSIPRERFEGHWAASALKMI